MRKSKDIIACCLFILCSICFCENAFSQTVVSKSIVSVSDYDAEIKSTELDKVWKSGYKHILAVPDSARLATYLNLQKLLADSQYTKKNTIIFCSEKTYEMTQDTCDGKFTISKSLESLLSPKGTKIKEYAVEKPMTQKYDYKFVLVAEH